MHTDWHQLQKQPSPGGVLPPCQISKSNGGSIDGHQTHKSNWLAGHMQPSEKIVSLQLTSHFVPEDTFLFHNWMPFCHR